MSGTERIFTILMQSDASCNRTLIQVLLHLLILSLPSAPLSKADRKRKRKKQRGSIPHGAGGSKIPAEDVLDILTDRLSIWRESELALAAVQPTREDSGGNLPDRGKDWLQDFCENVVRPE